MCRGALPIHRRAHVHVPWGARPSDGLSAAPSLASLSLLRLPFLLGSTLHTSVHYSCTRLSHAMQRILSKYLPSTPHVAVSLHTHMPLPHMHSLHVRRNNLTSGSFPLCGRVLLIHRCVSSPLAFLSRWHPALSCSMSISLPLPLSCVPLLGTRAHLLSLSTWPLALVPCCLAPLVLDAAFMRPFASCPLMQPCAPSAPLVP